MTVRGRFNIAAQNTHLLLVYMLHQKNFVVFQKQFVITRSITIIS